MNSLLNDESPIYSSLANDEMMCELVEEFVGDMPLRIEALRQALVADDIDTVQRLAHQLKGAFGSYGFEQMTEPARRLEKSAAESRDQIDVIRQDVDALVGYCLRLTAAKPPAAS